MGHLGCLFSRFGVLELVVGCLLAAGSCEHASLVAVPVTEAEVANLKMDHYFTPDRKRHDADFEWTFTKTGFVLKKARGPIPADLLGELLSRNTPADEIRGVWRLHKDGSLILTGIKAGEERGKEDATLLLYKSASAIARMDIGESQYVFIVGQPGGTP